MGDDRKGSGKERCDETLKGRNKYGKTQMTDVKGIKEHGLHFMENNGMFYV